MVVRDNLYILPHTCSWLAHVARLGSGPNPEYLYGTSAEKALTSLSLEIAIPTPLLAQVLQDTAGASFGEQTYLGTKAVASAMHAMSLPIAVLSEWALPIGDTSGLAVT